MKPIFNAKPIHWSYWIAISGLWLGIMLTNNGPQGMNWGPVVRYAGHISWYLLTFTVFISVLARLWPAQTWLGKLQALRKHTGLAGFLFALLHLIATYLMQSAAGKTLAEFWAAALSNNNSMILAWLGFVFLVPAFLSSCNWAIKKLGYGKWKILQRLVHPAYIFAALHIALLPYFRGRSIDWEPLVTAGLLLIGYLVLLIKYSKKNDELKK